VPSLDDVNGWWTWRLHSPDLNQYWGLSNDELNVHLSTTAALEGGLTPHGAGVGALQTFFGNVGYETHFISANPSTNVAIAPVGANGDGVYYQTGVGVPGSGDPVNGGFDMGRHSGISITGTGGVVNPNTGVGNQDPAGSPTTGLVPTFGLVTSDDAPSTLGGTARWHLGWVQLATDLSFGVDPAGTVDLGVGGPGRPARVPLSRQITSPVFTQPLTNALFPFFVYEVDERPLGWPHPSGLTSGTFFATSSKWGASQHLPLAGIGSVFLPGIPVGIQVGSTQLGGPTGPLLWGPGNNTNAPSQSTLVALID